VKRLEDEEKGLPSVSGFGSVFVEFNAILEAKRVRKLFDGRLFDGKLLRVTYHD
jgi:hypothetical protein